MRNIITSVIILLSLALNVQARDELELETTIIKGNKELPQILYLVPWKDVKKSQNKEQQLVLFSLFGDLFDPINSENLQQKISSTTTVSKNINSN